MRIGHAVRGFLGAMVAMAATLPASATPANKAALALRYDRFLSARLDACVACHQSNPAEKPPIDLKAFPHNPFGARLARLGAEWRAAGKRTDLDRRLQAIAREDADGDGVDNETEILAGTLPGDPKDRPTAKALAGIARTRTAFTAFRSAYRWQPLESVVRPPVPVTAGAPRRANPIDAFLDAARAARGLSPRPPADRATLLRRVTLDLTGLVPTPAEIDAFLADRKPGAYERVVDRLLASPRYGERWARHWMDVWRYSDWAGWADGGQIRDSQPHIWRWRDWIVESLNANHGYDRMVREMVAADEIAPGDSDALRATGFLARNFKLLSREQWLEDTVNHTSKAFLGITMHCAKCHNHMYDPIPQEDYYRFRAIFEPHQVRTDPVPGQPDTAKDGLARVYDADPKVATYLFVRGDERNPDKSHALAPGVPAALGGTLDIRPVNLPRTAYQPEKQPFVVREALAAAEAALLDAWKAAEASRTEPEGAERRRRADADVEVAQARHKALLAVLDAERWEDAGKQGDAAWKLAATVAASAQRAVAVAEARRAALHAEGALAKAADGAPKAEAQKKHAAAQTALDAALKAAQVPPTTAYTPRTRTFAAQSSGRRAALARWLTDRKNPLAARVAVNHLWLRHFGQALAPSVADFGRNGQKPTHPQLLDWLAAEFMDGGWDMKRLHRLIVTSDAYRMDSRSDPRWARKDPDNHAYWRMNARRLEAEAIRDNVLYAAGHLDEARGGPEIDHTLGLTSRRRSLYLRTAAEKQAEFLQVFDAPSVTECYERKQSVLPQQALAMANSALALREARALARQLVAALPYPEAAPRFVGDAFRRLLARPPSPDEMRLCLRFLADQPGKAPSSLSRRYENLVVVLFNHNDFVTIR